MGGKEHGDIESRGRDALAAVNNSFLDCSAKFYDGSLKSMCGFVTDSAGNKTPIKDISQKSKVSVDAYQLNNDLQNPLIPESWSNHYRRPSANARVIRFTLWRDTC